MKNGTHRKMHEINFSKCKNNININHSIEIFFYQSRKLPTCVFQADSRDHSVIRQQSAKTNWWNSCRSVRGNDVDRLLPFCIKMEISRNVLVLKVSGGVIVFS